jgi:hypothetical protein
MKGIKTFILTLFLIILIITFSCSSAININTIKINKFNNSHNLKITNNNLELPIWYNNDYWEYDNITLSVWNLFVELSNVELRVAEINHTNDEYKIEINGDVDFIIWNKLKIPYITIELEGIAHIKKSTLGIKDFTLNFKIFLEKNEVYFLDIYMKFSPEFDFFDFPINIFEQTWYTQTNISLSFNVAGDIFNVLDNYYIEDNLEYIKNESIGDYESFLLSGAKGNPSELWYSPEVGYLVNVNEYLKIFYLIDFFIKMDLLDTNFDPENVYNRPEIPTSPDIQGSGVAGEKHVIKTSTIDPNGDRIYYLFDWGDGNNSGWIGPYNSGEEVNASYVWAERGLYKTKVKAKDENNLKTAWSEPIKNQISFNKNKTNSNKIKHLLYGLVYYYKNLSNFF